MAGLGLREVRDLGARRRGDLTGVAGRLQDPFTQPRWWLLARLQPEVGRGDLELGDLLAAGSAVLQVRLEGCGLLRRQGIQSVGTGEGVDLRVHRSPPMQSRNRMRPSRIRVFTVDRFCCSSDATSG